MRSNLPQSFYVRNFVITALADFSSKAQKANVQDARPLEDVPR